MTHKFVERQASERLYCQNCGISPGELTGSICPGDPADANLLGGTGQTPGGSSAQSAAGPGSAALEAELAKFKLEKRVEEDRRRDKKKHSRRGSDASLSSSAKENVRLVERYKKGREKANERQKRYLRKVKRHKRAEAADRVAEEVFCGAPCFFL